MTRDDMSRALLSEHGVLLYCSTVGTFVRPAGVQIDGALLWGRCPCCDKYRRTGAEYDAQKPQPHVGRLPWTT